MQREKVTIKNEHSHLEIAKTNRAKWLGQAEKNITIKLHSIKKKTGHDFHSHTHTQREQKKKKSGCAHTKMKIKYINVPVSSWRQSILLRDF